MPQSFMAPTPAKQVEKKQPGTTSPSFLTFPVLQGDQGKTPAEQDLKTIIMVEPGPPPARAPGQAAQLESDHGTVAVVSHPMSAQLTSQKSPSKAQI